MAPQNMNDFRQDFDISYQEYVTPSWCMTYMTMLVLDQTALWSVSSSWVT